MKYWLCLEIDYLTKRTICCYLHNQNKITWTSSVCSLLFHYGFGHVWQNQELETPTFSDALHDCYLQGSRAEMMSTRTL